MYAIIYWINDKLFSYVCEDGELQVFDYYTRADKIAKLIDKLSYPDEKINTSITLYNHVLDKDDRLEARIISISGGI